VDFNMNSALFMINAYLVGQTGKLRPYLGGGGGIALIFADNYSNAGLDEAGTDYDNSDDVVALAWQLIAGADYFLDNNWSVFAEYKYLVFTDFDVFNGQSEVQFGDLDNHILNMGLRRNF
jgi:opacity protein-like surface antigen